jgi:toxin-antitoxin system PIN domain toxin
MHGAYREWLESAIDTDEAFGVSELVLSGFVRIVTHPRVFSSPEPVESALAFANAVRAAPNAVPVAPGHRHWSIFDRLCRESDARGNLVPDAYLAALAIESGSEWITTDRDYARFLGLRWRHPLAA